MTEIVVNFALIYNKSCFSLKKRLVKEENVLYN